MPSNLIAVEAENMIIEQEVSSAPLYKARYTRPTWPGGPSGATIAIGVDLGYTSHEELEQNWHGRLPDQMISILHQAVGLKGEAAHELVRSGKLNGVVVPWETAIVEFEQVEIPTWVAKTNRVFPNLDKLGPLCEGSMVSLCFNRGVAIQDPPGSDRRLEMRNIRSLLIAQDYDKIPAQFRSMKRLWNNGLVRRREVEAELFERGLAQFHAAV
jgi:hypothetical protein